MFLKIDGMKEVIIKVVTMLYDIDGNEIFDKSRKMTFVTIRQMCFYYLHYELDFHHKSIAEIFDLGRSNVILGIESFTKKMEAQINDRFAYNEFKKVFNEQNPMDKILLENFIKQNDKYLSSELKDYLKVRL